MWMLGMDVLPTERSDALLSQKPRDFQTNTMAPFRA